MAEAVVDLQGGASIELRLEELSRLFDPFDPFPIPTRDLARSAEDFIVSCARELPRGQALRIVVHLSQGEAQSATAAGLADAVRRSFSYRAERVRSDLHDMFRIGRLSLLIGLAGWAVACWVGDW